MIYTSYFGKMKSLDSSKVISIARWTPKWFNGRSLRPLFPSEVLLRNYKSGKYSVEDFTRIYNRQLTLFNVESFGNSLQGHILLCYEKPDQFCHRHLVAEWLRKSGFDCEEL